MPIDRSVFEMLLDSARQDLAVCSALVDTHGKTFEVYRRQPNGVDWLLSPGRAEQGLELKSVALTIPADALFENV